MLGHRIFRWILIFLCGSQGGWAQNYQSQFSAVEQDRTRGPVSWHEVVSVDAASGALNLDLPLGPGIGARGARFQPALRGMFKSSVELTQSQPRRKWVVNHEVPYVPMPVGMPTTWNQANLGPGYLEVSLGNGIGTVTWKGPEGQTSEWKRVSGTASGQAGSLLAGADPLSVVRQFAGYESGWTLSEALVGTPGTTKFLGLGTDGELLIGMENPGVAPAPAGVPLQVDAAGNATRFPASQGSPELKCLPPVVMVVKGDTAYEYRYESSIYERMRDSSAQLAHLADIPSALAATMSTFDSVPQTDLGSLRDFPAEYYDATGRLLIWQASKAHYRLTRILNRHHEWIGFSYPSQGAWTATWVVGDIPTGVSIAYTPSGSSSSSGASLAYSGLGCAQDFSLGWGPAGPPTGAMDLIWVRDVKGGMASGEGTAAFLLLPENWQRVCPGSVTSLSTGESAQFSFSPAPGCVTGDGTTWTWGGAKPVGSSSPWVPMVPTGLALPGRSLAFEWASYGYRRNAYDESSAFAGYVQGANLSYSGSGDATLTVPRYASFSGVAKVTETDQATGAQRVTIHHRVVPVPAWNTAAGWLSTQFYDAVVRPDGSTKVYRFVSPLSNGRTGGPSDSTPDEQMQTLAHLKHQIADIREYESGVAWESDLASPPGSQSPYRTTVYDRWDLRSAGNPGGELNVSSTPYATRVRTWSRELSTMTEDENLDWDAQNLGWKVHRRIWRKTAWASSDFLSLAAQSLPLPARPGATPGALPAVREEVRTLSRNLAEWNFDRTDTLVESHSDATAGLAGGSSATLDLPLRTTRWDSTVPFSRISSQQEGSGSVLRSTQFEYQGATGPAGLQMKSVTWTGAGMVLPPNPVGVSAYGYDSYGYRSAITPWLPTGQSWTLRQTSTGEGLPQTQTDANGLTTTYRWGAGGRLSEVLPPTRETPTRFEYDSDHLGLILYQGRRATHYRYNGFGQLIRVARQNADATWNHRLTGYDAMGRKIWETGWRPQEGVDNLWSAPLAPEDQAYPAQSAWTEVKPVYEFTPDGQRIIVDYVSVTHPAVPARLVNPNSTHYTYDGQGRITRIQKPGGEAEAIDPSVGGDGRVSRRTVAPGTPLEASTTLSRDDLGRLIGVVDAAGQATSYRYDAADRIKQVLQTDPKTSATQVRSWEYDALGRLTALVQPESGRTEFSGFTPHGRPTRAVYGAGSGGPRGLTITYDELGRVRSEVSDDGTVNHTYTYDEGGGPALANGKLTRTAANGVVRALGYNGSGGLNGRLTTLQRTVDGLPAFTQSVTYSDEGWINSRTYPDGRVEKVDHDLARGLPTSATFGGSALANLGYDPTSWNLTQLSFANGASCGFAYDADQVRLKSLSHGIPGAAGIPSSWSFRYDEAGRLSTDGEDWFSYDKLDRLTSAFVRDPFNAAGSQGLLQEFGYDAFGNRLSLNSWTVTNWNPGTAPPGTAAKTSTAKALSWAFNASDPALSAQNHLPGTMASGASTGAQYDPQGNLTRLYGPTGNSGSLLILSYDTLGRVTSLGDTRNATSQTYGYDDEGLRIKTVDTKTGVTTYHIYDEGRKLIAVYERSGSASPVWKKDIVYVGAREVAELGSDGKVRVTLCDHLGSPRYTWDGTAPSGGKPDGVHLLVQKFLPFGEPLSDPATQSKFAKGFTNHEQTDPSGLIYMQARFYAPWYGRFLSPDPARDQLFEQTQSWNIYSYVQNNPTMRIDPTGMIGVGPDGGSVSSYWIHKLVDLLFGWGSGRSGAGSATRSSGGNRSNNSRASANLARAKKLVAAGKLVGDGECPQFTKAATGNQNHPTGGWIGSRPVIEVGAEAGTPVMTRGQNGHYPKGNNTPKHTGITGEKVAPGANSFLIIDQWAARNGAKSRKAQPPHEHRITNHHGKGGPQQDASRYVIIDKFK